MTKRTCTGCERELSEDDFHPSALLRPKARCKSCVNTRVASRYKKLKSEKRCFDCRKRIKRPPVCKGCREKRLTAYHTRYRDKDLESGKLRRRRDKLEAFDAYGGPICKCCGEERIEFLSLDHIAGDGARHRREVHAELGWKSAATGVHLARWLRKRGWPKGFQVLCMNCNFAKGQNGECPHETERRSKPQLALV